MQFESLNDVLTFAIRREHDARELYLMFRDMVKDPGAKALLEDLANQELGHRNLLENALKGGNIERIGGKKEIKDLHLSDQGTAITVTLVEELGADTFVYGDMTAADGSTVNLVARDRSHRAPRPGETAHVVPERTYLFQSDGDQERIV